MPINKSEKIWFNGELVPWDQARIHVMSHVLHYGSSVFEGIRCYDTRQGSAVFRLRSHVRRLFDSAKIYRMEIKYTPEQIEQAILGTIRANKLPACYIRPLVFRGYDSIGVDPRNCPVEVVIATIEWGRYLGQEAIENGVDVCVSSWNRMAPNTFPAMAKVGGHYANSQLMKMEALINGYSEAIALDVNGYVSEGSGENIFVIRDGVIITPPLGGSILSGITRDSVLQIIKGLGYELREQLIPREALYLADEVFLTGTAAEVSPIRTIDRIAIGSGKRGPITAAIQKEFFGIVTGELEDKYGWLTPVNN
ncbi:MAG: branched-chain amino acid transaminase [Chloroflexi bacterium]|nr:branched-chain amino acid transaminase [Chloroflexota bacterium]